MSNITRLMEAKPAREMQQEEKQPASSSSSSTSRTVDELLKMLSASGSRKAPPPVPPKPTANIESTLEAARRSLGISKTSRSVNSGGGGDFVDKFDSAMKLDAKSRVMQNDNRNHNGSPDLARKQPTARNVRTPIGCVVYDSTTTNIGNSSYRDSETQNASPVNRPIVTEYLEEPNNNQHVMNRMSNSSTVEILEIPSSRLQSTDNIYDEVDNTTYISLDREQQQHYRNNNNNKSHASSSNARPLIITNNHYEEVNRYTDDGSTLPIDVEVASITNEPSSDDTNPPRTSTPTSTQCKLNNSSSSGASTATNNNRSSQNTYLSYNRHRDSNSDQTDDDTFNVSRETDELDTSGQLNRSGCELVGVNDNSDPNNSKEIIVDDTERLPYTVQTFNDTMMSSSSISPKTNNETCNKPVVIMEQTSMQQQQHQQEARDLRILVSRLQDEIDSLHNKVANLTSKVDDLETQLDEQKRENSQIRSNINNMSMFSSQGALSPSSPLSKSNNYSKSTSTINKTFTTPSNRPQSEANYSPMATYSRNRVATITRNSNASPATYTSTGPLAAANSYGGGRITSSRSNSSMARPLRKSTAAHTTSTNSLYADSMKSGSTSISPTHNGPTTMNRHQTASPTSLMNLSMSKREPYTSMMSLSSVSTTTTLKKGSTMSGSVSNVSQISSQLTNWPSMSNFVSQKHQAKDILYDEEERLIRMVLYNTLLTMRVPSWVEEDYNLDRVIDPPKVRLKLDWVHGYRGRDCRTNIYYLPTGECIYFVASIVILYNPDEKKQRHYLGHTDSVKCLAIHPNKLIVASGQSAIANRRDKRPIVRVWDTIHLATLRVIGFNEDFDRSICCLAFSKHDQGATLAVVDESNEHTITLLDWQREKNWRIAETNSGHEPVLAIDFHPIDKYSLVAVGKSTINFWDIRGMTLAKKAGLFDKYDRPKYVLCLTFNDLGETITGDSNGNIIIWPRGSNRPGRVIHDVHPGGVFSVLAMKDGSYLTGGRDRRIIEWDESFAPTGRQAELPEHCGGVRFITYARGSQVLIGTLRNSILIGTLDTNFTLIMQGHTEATTALAVHPNEPKYLTGGFDEQIHFINGKNHQLEWTKCLMLPITAAGFSSIDGQLLVLGSTQGKWLVLDTETQETLFSACDGSATINCVKFSPNGEYFAMGSSDSQVYIYQVEENGSKFVRVGTCVGHSAPIREIDWSLDSRYIQTQSMNLELLFWRSDNCRPVDDQDVVHELEWATHNCSLGFNVLGIWSDSIDSALINHCDKSNSSDLIVSATDTGFLNIQQWPACYNQCLSQKYNGNVDKFNFVKFLSDDSKLIAVGAKNCVTTEWIVDREVPVPQD